MQDPRLTMKMTKALDFLNEHPATNGDLPFVNALWWSAYPVCKNGEPKEDYVPVKKTSVYINKGTKLFERFKDRFLDDPEDTFMHVPYREVYGCEWEFAKYVYSGEFSIYRADAASLSKRKKSEYYAYPMYGAYQGGFARKDSFEEMIIECARIVKRDYGNFTRNDFLTKEEVENHRIERCFFTEDCIHEGKPAYQLVDNPKYINVTNEQLNLRWWEWYKTTKHCLKNWKWIVEGSETT